jgi:hypothetical protein
MAQLICSALSLATLVLSLICLVSQSTAQTLSCATCTATATSASPACPASTATFPNVAASMTTTGANTCTGCEIDITIGSTSTYTQTCNTAAKPCSASASATAPVYCCTDSSSCNNVQYLSITGPIACYTCGGATPCTGINDKSAQTSGCKACSISVSTGLVVKSCLLATALTSCTPVSGTTDCCASSALCNDGSSSTLTTTAAPTTAAPTTAAPTTAAPTTAAATTTAQASAAATTAKLDLPSDKSNSCSINSYNVIVVGLMLITGLLLPSV